MANETHQHELEKGVESWNQFRDRTKSEPVDLSGLDLNGADLSGSNLIRANLRGASLNKAQLDRAHLKGADLSECELAGANFEHANARDARFNDVKGRNARFLVATLRRASFRNAQLQGATFYRAYLRGADFSDADLTGARLAKAYLERARCVNTVFRDVDFRGASMVKTNLDGADLSGSHVYGVAAWSTSLNDTTQNELLISRTANSPPLYVEDLNSAQLISLVVDNAKIRSFLDSVSSKFVLILGRFSDERKPVLDRVRETIREFGYVGVMFDFKRSADSTFDQVIMTLGGLSRFVIADLTDPKVVLKEISVILKNYPTVPVRPILKQGHELNLTTLDHALSPAFLVPVFRYQNSDHLVDSMREQIIDPAETRARELEARLTAFMQTELRDQSGGETDLD